MPADEQPDEAAARVPEQTPSPGAEPSREQPPQPSPDPPAGPPPEPAAEGPREPEPEPGEDRRNPTRQEAQLRHLLRVYDGEVGRGPVNWRETGTRYLYREHHLLVRDEYLARIVEILGDVRLVTPLVRGVTLISFPMTTMEALDRISGVVREEDAGRPMNRGVAAPDYLLTITGGTGAYCPASEPLPVPSGLAPEPGPAGEPARGEGIRVVVLDTGLDQDARYAHRWLDDVTGDPDPNINGPVLGPYAGHGTFVAGVLRCMAPSAEVIVRSVFHKAGASFESDLVRGLDRILDEDFPDVISMSAGTDTFDPTGVLGLIVFEETRLRHHKGVVLVAAAGNDGTRRPFWPAAAPWTVSVGALARDWRQRADFSNFGRWVDVYAPGEDLINAYPAGTYTYYEPSLSWQQPHQPGDQAEFSGMARWSGTSFSTPLVAGMIAARMSGTGENGRDAAAALLAGARADAIFGLGAVLLPA